MLFAGSGSSRAHAQSSDRPTRPSQTQTPVPSAAPVNPDRVEAPGQPAMDPPAVSVAAPAPPATAPAAERSPLDQAHQDAIAALRREVLGTPFSTDLTIGQAARKMKVAAAIDQALQTAEQPGGVRWRDKVCELRLELPGATLAAVLADADRKQPGALGMTSESFQRRLASLRTLRFSAIGSSAAAFAEPVALPNPAAIAPVPARLVPVDPPDWAGRQMDADGRGDGGGLKGARAAEAVAQAQLRQQLDTLALTSDTTLGQAVTKDGRLNLAVARAMRHARVSRVTYGVDVVEVRMSLDLAHLWRELVRVE